ncbi:HAD family hydrolase [Methylobacter sp. S3L5C]|uniref:HAD family hydrolase n=1 Tax=Methylobacter sp. S3L5C TaxID=2839024 RepID=UPI001FACE9CF|nr:HAD family hydrolase [Methylobacter sp. S3L5C]UOA08563.1 HAD family hydrolase [Methylobacter sp. S3L5C]
MNNSIIYALDFDGVICDSAVETAITGWKAAGSIWGDMPKTAPQAMIDQFRLVRPIIETGYEAILAMRLLYLQEPVEAIYSDYGNKIHALLTEAKISTDELKKLFGETRDAWIADDLTGWVNMNPLFDGVAQKLREIGQQYPWYVITTKQERFVKQILKANTIELADECIFGLDRNMNKMEVLSGLLETHPNKTIYFMEDRWPTLLNVLNNNELASVKLIFALWGYNTAQDKALAAEQAVTLQQLDSFLVL